MSDCIGKHASGCRAPSPLNEQKYLSPPVFLVVISSGWCRHLHLIDCHMVSWFCCGTASNSNCRDVPPGVALCEHQAAFPRNVSPKIKHTGRCMYKVVGNIVLGFVDSNGPIANGDSVGIHRQHRHTRLEPGAALLPSVVIAA